MSNTVIKVENLSKIYRLGEIGTGSIGQDIDRWFKTKVMGKEDPFLKIGETNDRASKGDSDIVYSLRDINFEIQQGDAVGILGRNGAGKSTLLKILSRVTTPTTGKINIKGRVASLLEVGTGFHPELTGRENIYLNGAILGMRKREIDRKLDEIIDFSGVERYIDTPVKRYSSGMYVRLAFAVAAHLESEILIVDEVLAVGDIEFQKKCLGKMSDVSKGEGRTVLFVSHNLQSIKTLCNSGILLDKGEMRILGPTEDVLKAYEEKKENRLKATWENYRDRDQRIFVKTMKVFDKNHNSKLSFASNEEIFVELKVESIQKNDHIKVGFDLIKNHEVVFRTEQIDTNRSTTFNKGTYCFVCTIPKNILNSGNYMLRPLLSEHCVENLVSADDEADGVSFDIELNTSASDYHIVLNEKNHPGAVYPFLKWEVMRLE